jgi:hypothetical protein
MNLRTQEYRLCDKATNFYAHEITLIHRHMCYMYYFQLTQHSLRSQDGFI